MASKVTITVEGDTLADALIALRQDVAVTTGATPPPASTTTTGGATTTSPVSTGTTTTPPASTTTTIPPPTSTGTSTTAGGTGSTTTTTPPATSTTPPVSTGPSPDGLHAASITDATGAVWTFGGSLGINALRNGVATHGGGTTFLYWKGNVYVRGDDTHWYRYNGSIWIDSGTADPSAGAVWPLLGIAGKTSPNGSVADAAHNYQFIDPYGRVVSIGGNGFQTTIDGKVVGGGGNPLKLWNNQIFTLGDDGKWYIYTGAAYWPFPPNTDPELLPDQKFATTFTPPPGAASGAASTTTTTPTPPPPAPVAPIEPTPNAIAPGSSGKTLAVGPGQQYAKITDAVAAAAAGDTVTLAAGVYAESFSNTVPLRIVCEPGAIIDCAGMGLDQLANKRGAISPMADIEIEGLEIRNVFAGADTVGAIRTGASCIVKTKNVTAHECCMGFFSGDGYAVNWYSDSDTLYNNGTGDGKTHNVYFSRGVVRNEFVNPNFTKPNGGHALKTRATGVTKVTGGLLSATDGFPLDIPDGSFSQCTVSGTKLQKPAGSANHTIMAYAEETPSNGTAGVAMTGVTLDAPDGANIRCEAGTVSIDAASAFNGAISAQGAGTVTGLK